jgi:hypothetical protein
MLSYATLSILCYWRDEDRALGNHLEMMTPLLLTVFDATEQKKSQGHTSTDDRDTWNRVINDYRRTLKPSQMASAQLNMPVSGDCIDYK